MKARLILVLTLVAVSLGGCVRDSEARTEQRIASVERGLRVEFGDPPWATMELSRRMDHYHVAGLSIAVINDFQIEWAKGYGVLEAGRNEPVTPATLFQAASVGKLVVAVAALHYVESGPLTLDRDVNESLVSWHIPENEFTAAGDVTLRRLLSHSAGVTVGGFRGYALGEHVPTLRQILDGEWPANSPPIRVDTVPGTQRRYSGGGYMIVQQLLEDTVSQPFPNIMQDTVLGPWAMTASTFESPLPEQLRAIAASGHRADGSAIVGGWHTYPEMGSGASMWATASDLARFAIGVMQSYAGKSDRVLSRDLAVQMLTPQIDEGAKPP